MCSRATQKKMRWPLKIVQFQSSGRAARGATAVRISGAQRVQLVAQLRRATPEFRARSLWHSSGAHLQSSVRAARGTAPQLMSSYGFVAHLMARLAPWSTFHSIGGSTGCRAYPQEKPALAATLGTALAAGGLGIGLQQS